MPLLEIQFLVYSLLTRVFHLLLQAIVAQVIFEKLYKIAHPLLF